MSDLIDILLHIDIYLEALFSQIGIWIYVVLFFIIFSETGFVITPFLPGDSLLFAVGALSSREFICPWSSFILISIAAVLGNTLNYHIGKFIGPKIFHKENSLLFNKKHLQTTALFYEKHGAKTIIIARFLPILRTFAPFVAGIGKMRYPKFQIYNIFSSMLWSGSFIFAGYFFGNLPFVKQNFSMFILGIIIISVIPTIWKALMIKRSEKT
ncbi:MULTISPECIES: DedA family protein [Thermodesulfovibrio]|jgi:membrane-associated protein|uniref:DedA protein n=2 Tax=Thermodesulfovibrio yellowstonii TaxID=28262 RepID=B5YGY4_THEYD|nr:MULTISPECIES: DedA family protein [Thermodesulfovibrio]ACI21813.1 DedA protein [Thermodesulfovibrio yellowstonii DSM 11347]GLI52970.1 membrane protein [Thermodesulfovibrio islandicus]